MLGQVERGQGMVVGVVAEPGMGKSRLLYEFLQSLEEKDMAYLAGHCVSYGGMMPYLPVLDMLRQQCGITAGDSPEAVVAHVQQHLQQSNLVTDDEMAYVFHLLGVKEGTDHLALLGSETVKSRTFETLWHLLRSRSEQQPLILVVEDLHWVDQSSQDFHHAGREPHWQRHSAPGHLPSRLPTAVDRQVLRDTDGPAAPDLRRQPRMWCIQVHGKRCHRRWRR